MNEMLALSRELYWLVLTLLMTALMWVPYIGNRLREQGVLNALWIAMVSRIRKCVGPSA